MGVVTYQKKRKKPRNILSVIRDVGTTTQSKTHLENMGIDFDYPKPVELISYLIKMSTNKNSIILDSFAGSGTTTEAVLRLNKEDNGKRKFILVELEKTICNEITSQRIRKVIEGYKSKRNEKIEGLGGDFTYCILDKKLFSPDGMINELCTFKELALYIYFTETNTILDPNKINKTLIGIHNEMEFHLLFNGVGKNILDTKFLNSLNKKKEKIIYADKCTVSDDVLEQHKTIFKQIPYEIRVF